MVVLRIPDQDVNGLKKIRELSEKIVKELIGALLEAPPVMDRKELTQFLAAKVSNISEADLEEIVRVLIAMSSARLLLDWPLSEFTERVCQAIEQVHKEELKFTEKTRESFRGRLTRLLNHESLVLPAKANNIMLDHERVYIRARTLTDVRAIFGSDTEKPPKAAAIIHMLNVSFRRGNKEENFYVAMNSEDVESLIVTLQRALSKSGTLKKTLDTANILNIE